MEQGSNTYVILTKIVKDNPTDKTKCVTERYRKQLLFFLDISKQCIDEGKIIYSEDKLCRFVYGFLIEGDLFKTRSYCKKTIQDMFEIEDIQHKAYLMEIIRQLQYVISILQKKE